MLRYNTNLDLV